MACRADGASWGHCASRGANSLRWFWLSHMTHMTHVLNCTFWTLLIHFVDLETSPGSLHVSTSSQSFGIYTCNPGLALAGRSNMNLVVSRTQPQVKHFEGLSRCPCRRDLNSCCFSCAESDRCGPSPSGNWKVRDGPASEISMLAAPTRRVQNQFGMENHRFWRLELLLPDG